MTKGLDFTGKPYSLLLTVCLAIKTCVSNVYAILKANEKKKIKLVDFVELSYFWSTTLLEILWLLPTFSCALVMAPPSV